MVIVSKDNPYIQKEGTLKVKLYPLEWFEKNCVKDIDNDWWRLDGLYELFNNWEGDNDVDNPHAAYLIDNLSIGGVVDVRLDEFRHWGWAVEKYLTPETDPEYYL